MRLFLAGGEAWLDLLLELGVRNILMTYVYLRDQLNSPRTRAKALTFLDKVRYAKSRGYRFMLDSGAYTYRTNVHKGELPPIDVYFSEYKEFLFEYGDLFDVFVEMDVENTTTKSDGKVISLSEVSEWAYDLMEIPDIGWRTMQIYHASRGVPWLLRALANTKSPYLGVGSGMTNYGEVAATVAKAREWGKFTHGFGQTRIKTDMKYLMDFSSVDSTTWLRSDKFGGTTIFDNNKFVSFDSNRKHERRKYVAFYEKWGLDFHKILADDLEENRKASIIAWREVGNSFENTWHARGQKHPYLYQHAINGTLPAEHPLLTAEKEARRFGTGPRAKKED